jgi:hypothetical protein
VALLTSLLFHATLSCVKSTSEKLTGNLPEDLGFYSILPKDDGTNTVYLVTFGRDVERDVPRIPNLHALFNIGFVESIPSGFLLRILSLRTFDTLSIPGVKLSAEGLGVLAGTSQQLKYLNLAATTITDDVLLAIVKHAPLLEYLCLSNCSSLTRDGIVTALSHGKSLRRVLIPHGKLTEQDIADLERRKPGVVHEYEKGSPVDRRKK